MEAHGLKKPVKNYLHDYSRSYVGMQQWGPKLYNFLLDW